MSQRIQAAANQAVSRACWGAALSVGAVTNAFSASPLLAFKIGGLSSLIVSLALLLLAGRAERTCFTKTRLWRSLEGHERPAVDKAQAVIGGARRRALETYAAWFAVAAAVFLAIEIAGEVNLWLYPLR